MERRGIAAATAVIMLGTLTTSVLGFVRAFVVARVFGAGTDTDAFFAALIVPQILYSGLVGGAVSGVLIPTFSRMASGDKGELWLLVRTVFVLEGLLALAVVAVLEVLAHPLMIVVASGFLLQVHAGALPLSVQLVRVLLITLVFSSLSAVALAALYSLGRRAVSSFAPSLYHLGILGAALAVGSRFGIMALAVGAVAGSALQLAVQVPSLIAVRRNHPAERRPLVDFHHPAIRQLLRLYGPVAGGLAVTVAGGVADINLKSHLPQVGGLSSMQYASQIVQFPVGIVGTALPFAVLPVISREAGREQLDRFTDTLVLGMRASVVLMVPAAVGLFFLATPIAALVYQRGQFTPLDTSYTARALIGYAPQLPLVAVSQLLVYAFYARHNTLTPALAGIVGVGVYVTGALLLAGLTILGLALADTISVFVQMLLLLALIVRVTGAGRFLRMAGMLGKIAMAGSAMAAAIGLADRYLSPAGTGTVARLEDVLIPGGMALAVYLLMLVLLKVEEVKLAVNFLAQRWSAERARL